MVIDEQYFKCPKCGGTLQWRSNYSYKNPTFWDECPECGYRTDEMKAVMNYASSYPLTVPDNYYDEATFPDEKGWVWLD